MAAAATGNPDTVLVVTGLPRAGTSLVMQMLEAGGVPLLTDAERPPDEHNPRGYFEYARVKRLRDDATWLPQARGRAVKVIAPLVTSLPESETYRFILVERAMEEVLESQRRMTGMSGTETDTILKSALQKSLDLAMRRIDILSAPLLRLTHRDLLAEPHREAKRIAEFIESAFAQEEASACVEQTLYRSRGS